MLTEKSITQQLRFHKLPFPEDLGRGWATVVLEEITAFFEKVGLRPSSEGAPAVSHPEGGEVREDLQERRRESPGEKGLVPTRPYHCRSIWNVVQTDGDKASSLSQKKEELEGSH